MWIEISWDDKDTNQILNENSIDSIERIDTEKITTRKKKILIELGRTKMVL